MVAVGLGGIVKRKEAEKRGAEYFKNGDRLATVDPLTGMGCCASSSVTFFFSIAASVVDLIT